MANTIRGRLLAKGDDEEEESEEESEVSPTKVQKQSSSIIKMIEEGPIIEPNVWCRYSVNPHAKWHFHQGCHVVLKRWLDSCADALFVIGFCVIAFLKLTFLGLLRFEIQEMIQKIQVLKVSTVYTF